MKNINPLSLFDDFFNLETLSKLGDPLEKLNSSINWGVFEMPLSDAFNKSELNKGKGGRPPFSRIMLFKALIIQSLYNLSDDQLEFQIIDRASFKRFLGLKRSDKVPDSKTFWAFREQLAENKMIEKLFHKFSEALQNAGIQANEGKMIDASFVEVPRQRNTHDENEQIKETGKAPKEWKKNKHKMAQKDVQATWTKKNNQTFYGYKNHVKADLKTKFIERYIITTASVHDSKPLSKLLGKEDKYQPLYADSAYSGEPIGVFLEKRKIVNMIHEKGCRERPLTDAQKNFNKLKSTFRARVEHIFGFIENSMNGSFIRTIGIKRAKTKIGLMNLTYNICRCQQLKIVLA